jgi:hypothetical protein
LTAKDEEDKDYLRGQLDNLRSQKDRELTMTRKDRDQKVQNLKTRLEDQRQALSEKYQDDLAREEERYDGHLQNMRDGFKEEIGLNQEKYKNRSEQLADQYQDHYESLKSKVNDRVDKQVDGLRRENQELGDRILMTKEKDKIQNTIENDHLVGEYENKYDELEYRREAAAQAAHEEKTKDIYMLQKNHDRENEKRTAEFANKINSQKIQDDVNMESQVGQAYRDRDLNKIQTDVQKRRVYEVYADKTNDQAEFYNDSLNAKQNTFEKMSAEQRGVWEKQKAQEMGTLQTQLAKENVAHQEKLMDTVGNYEKQLAQTKNDYEKRLRHQAELFRDQTDKQVKAMQSDREASEAKLNARLSQTKEFYEREMDELRKRQIAERQDLATKKNS